MRTYRCVTSLTMTHFEVTPTPVNCTGGGACEAANAPGVLLSNSRRAVQRLDRLALLYANDDQVERYALYANQ